MERQPRWAEMCARILQQCEHLQGGREPLAEFLGVPARDLQHWVEGRAGPPRAVFERAIELILAEHDRRSQLQLEQVAPKRRSSDQPRA